MTQVIDSVRKMPVPLHPISVLFGITWTYDVALHCHCSRRFYVAFLSVTCECVVSLWRAFRLHGFVLILCVVTACFFGVWHVCVAIVLHMVDAIVRTSFGTPRYLSLHARAYDAVVVSSAALPWAS